MSAPTAPSPAGPDGARATLRARLGRRPPAQWALAAAALLYVVLAVTRFARTGLMDYLDTRDYQAVARRPLASAAFWLGARPPGYPLLLKLFQGAPAWLLRLQLLLHVAGFLLLAWSLARLCRRPWLRVGCFAVVLATSLTSGLFYWTSSLSTESTSLSLLALALGLVVLGWPPGAEARYPRARALGIALALVPWAATRDANAGWLPVAALATAATAWWGGAGAGARRASLVLVAGALLLAAASSVSIDRGGRWRYPLVNALGQRILPNAERRARFERGGMPDNPRTRCFVGRWAPDCHADFTGFEPWLTRQARHDYALDLVTHPYPLLIEPLLHWRALLCGQRRDEPASPPLGYYFYFATPPAWQKALSVVLLAEPWFLVAELVLAAALLVALRRRRRPLDRGLAPPLVLGATAYPLLLLVWHGDAMEIQRHALVLMMVSRVALWGTIALAADRIFNPEKVSQPTKELSQRGNDPL
jgi:hypothetical protein